MIDRHDGSLWLKMAGNGFIMAIVAIGGYQHIQKFARYGFSKPLNSCRWIVSKESEQLRFVLSMVCPKSWWSPTKIMTTTSANRRKKTLHVEIHPPLESMNGNHHRPKIAKPLAIIHNYHMESLQSLWYFQFCKELYWNTGFLKQMEVCRLPANLVSLK